MTSSRYCTPHPPPPAGEAAAYPCDPRRGVWGGLRHRLRAGLPAAARRVPVGGVPVTTDLLL